MIKKILVLCLLAACYGLVWAGGELLQGKWANQSGAFTFHADGTALIEWAQGARLSGRWQLSGATLNIQTPRGPMVFMIQQQGARLVMKDNQGIYVFQRVTSGQTETPTPPVASPVAPPGGKLTDKAFARFLETYRSMSAALIYQHAMAMTDDQRQYLNIWEALGSDIYTRICKSAQGAGFVWHSASGPVYCQQLIAWEQQALAYGAKGQEADIQRMQVINMFKCRTGELSKEVCRSYRSAIRSYQEGSIDTMRGIVKNMEPPPCTPRYDQNNAYLGCW